MKKVNFCLILFIILSGPVFLYGVGIENYIGNNSINSFLPYKEYSFPTNINYFYPLRSLSLFEDKNLKVRFLKRIDTYSSDKKNLTIHIKLSKWIIYLFSSVIFIVVVGYIKWRLKTTRVLNKRLAQLVKELTDSKKDLEVERNRLLTIINNIPDLVYVKDREGRFVIANPPVIKFMCGDSDGDLIGKTDFDFYPANVAAQLFADEQMVMNSGTPIIQKEEHLYSLQGEEIWFSTSKVPLRDNKGNIIGLVGVNRNITSRKLAEKELEEQKNRIKQYLDIAGVIIVVLDREGKIKLLNRKGCEIIGINEEEAIGKDWFDLCEPEDIRERNRSFYKEVVSGKSDLHLYSESAIIDRNNRKRIVAWHNTFVKDEDGNIIGVLSSGEDITDKIESEKKLKETKKKLEISQRLEAIGRLTSGIAHDFNNLLSVIIGYSDLLKMRADRDAPYIKEIEEIRKAGERATALINQLLTFSRKQSTKPLILNLNKLIKNIEKMLSRTIGENIELIVNLDPDLGNIKADPSQIDQIIMNLVVNAKHAMPNGGKLTIETQNVYLDENYVKDHPGVTPGNYVMFSVSDSGVGMNEETKEHIFEPFFTTKENGFGTGLGLSTVYGIVKQSEGSIWVYSEPGKGTVFKIYFPRVEDDKIDSNRKISKPTDASVKGCKRILLLEDEEQVRDMVRSVLETSGYEVVIAKNGEEGLGIVKKVGIEKIDFIITDIIMPKMGGYDFIKRLKELNPERRINVLFISGYSEVTISENEFNGESFSMLQKPFTADQLLEKIKEMLGRNR